MLPFHRAFQFGWQKIIFKYEWENQELNFGSFVSRYYRFVCFIFCLCQIIVSHQGFAILKPPKTFMNFIIIVKKKKVFTCVDVQLRGKSLCCKLSHILILQFKQWIWIEKDNETCTVKFNFFLLKLSITFSSRQLQCFLQDLIFQSNICLVLALLYLRCLHCGVIR